MKAHMKSDRDWEAEDDARTLMRAEEIRGDSKRIGRAKKALTRVQKQAAEAATRAALEAETAKRLQSVFEEE